MAEYTGAVAPGGPTHVRELGQVVIRKVTVAPMSNNVYLLTCRATGQQLMIDAAGDAPRLGELVREGSGALQHLVTTHRHHDHVGALAHIVEAYSPRTYAGADDADHLPVPPDVRLEHGDRIDLGEVRLEVIHLRGHTAGSVALAYADPEGHAHVFTGDSLFPGGVGATNKPEQSFESLINDVVERVFSVFDDDTWIYPGHGDDTVLGRERPHVPSWRDRGW